VADREKHKRRNRVWSIAARTSHGKRNSNAMKKIASAKRVAPIFGKV
jgi:hypothetical protein